MRILVTGATGFIGGRLCERLTAAGHHVVAFARATSDTARIQGRIQEVVTGDVTDPASLSKAVDSIGAVCHLAAALVAANPSAQQYVAVNVDGTRNLCDAMVDRGVRRLIYCSTVGVFGPVENPPADENCPKRPMVAYEKTKCAAEEVVLSHLRRGSLDATVIRPAVVYGLEDTRSGIFSLFSAIARRRFRLVGRGDNLIHMLHVEDLVDVFMAAIENDGSVGRDYNIGGEAPCTFRHLCEAIAGAEGVPFPRRHVPLWVAWPIAKVGDALARAGLNFPVNTRSVTFLTTHRSYDISRARAELGYRPRRPLESGIRETVGWYRDHGCLP